MTTNPTRTSLATTRLNALKQLSADLLARGWKARPRRPRPVARATTLGE